MIIKLPDNVKWKYGEPSESTLFSLWVSIAASSKSDVFRAHFKHQHNSQIPDCILLHYGQDETGYPNWQVSIGKDTQGDTSTIILDRNRIKSSWVEWGGDKLEDKTFSEGMMWVLNHFQDFIKEVERAITECLSNESVPIDLKWDRDGVFILHVHAWAHSPVELYAVPVSAGTLLRDLHFPCGSEDYVDPTVIAIGDKYAFRFNPGHFDDIYKFTAMEDARDYWLKNCMNVMHGYSSVFFIPAEEAVKVGLWEKGKGWPEVNLMGIFTRGLQLEGGETVQMGTIV